MTNTVKSLYGANVIKGQLHRPLCTGILKPFLHIKMPVQNHSSATVIAPLWRHKHIQGSPFIALDIGALAQSPIQTFTKGFSNEQIYRLLPRPGFERFSICS